MNPTYHDLARPYGVAVLPARVRRPSDKAPAEVAVQVVERWILAAFRRRSFSLVELNAAIAHLLEGLNTRRFRKLPGSRRSQFEQLDRPAVRPLPDSPYVCVEWKAVRVATDYHVEVDGHYYSVPHALVRRQLDVRLTVPTVECFHRGQLGAGSTAGTLGFERDGLGEGSRLAKPARLAASGSGFRRVLCLYKPFDPPLQPFALALALFELALHVLVLLRRRPGRLLRGASGAYLALSAPVQFCAPPTSATAAFHVSPHASALAARTDAVTNYNRYCSVPAPANGCWMALAVSSIVYETPKNHPNRVLVFVSTCRGPKTIPPLKATSSFKRMPPPK